MPFTVRIRNSSVLHFSHIFPWTEYGEIRISLYSVRMGENAEKMRTRISPNTDTFCAVFSIKILANYISFQVEVRRPTKLCTSASKIGGKLEQVDGEVEDN